MKIDLQASSLYTDAGKFLKKLHCPLDKSWDELKPLESGSRMCSSCSRVVHKTASMTDEELESLLAKDPEACLMISLTQANCTVLPHGMRPIGSL